MLADNWQTKGQFVIKCEEKNRFGPAGRQVTFKHTNDGVICTSQGKLTEDMELIDDSDAITLIEGIAKSGGDISGLDDPEVVQGGEDDDDGDDE